MSSIFRPFKALRPEHSQIAKKIIAPPYDVMTADEARKHASKSALSFVHVSRAEVNLEHDIDVHSQAVYNQAAQAMERLIKEGNLIQEEKESWYIIQIEDQFGHIQTGFGGVASCLAYDQNLIARHELTRPDKEEDRLNQIHTIGAQTGPVLLTHKPNEILDSFVQKYIKDHPPVIEAQTPHDHATHRLWVVSQPEEIKLISEQFDQMEKLWIADGHHRSAAATRLSKRISENNAASWFLAVTFPSDQMKLLDYNRLVKNLNNLTEEAFLEKISVHFDVQKQKQIAHPSHDGQIILFLKNSSYQLTYKADKSEDAVKSLDVAILSDFILEPILGIHDQRTDERLHFAGGVRGLEYLQKNVDSGLFSCAFAMYPTSMMSVMDVADADKIMPPKSTWFEPKLADGLISHKIIKR